MSIPERVRVGCMTYAVMTDPAAIQAASESADIGEGSEWTAYSDHDALVIGINPGNPLAVQKRDLLHEVLHCCLRYAGVEPNAYARVVARARERHDGYTVEEFTIAPIAGPLLTALRDNPGLTNWLLEDA